VLGEARTPVSWPCQIGVLPLQAECWQHRGAADELEHAVAAGGTAVLCQVLSGTGGVGKTQLAAAYARAAWQARTMDLLMWVTASSRAGVLAAYAQAGALVASAKAGDPEQAAARFLAWLETTSRSWLVVLDDLANPADLRGLWPPASNHGRVLVTTRRRDAVLAGESRCLIQVGLFTPGEASAYLTAKLAAHARTDEPEQVADLAADLGYLPLALAQAAAYLIDLDLDCESYRRRLADRRRTLPELTPDDAGLPDDQRAALGATWSLSIEHAGRLRPAGLALPMLELASMLDSNGVPQQVLTSPPALTYLAQHRTISSAPASHPGIKDADAGGSADAQDAADALRCLHRLNLADLDPGSTDRGVRVHNLIQRATRESLPPARRTTLARAAADALLAAWPEVERDTALVQALRSCTSILAGHAGADLWQNEAHAVLFRVGLSLGEAGLTSAALSECQERHAAVLRYLGPDHPGTVNTRGNLAYWRGKAGDAAGAAAAFEELLADCLRVAGTDHPATLNIRGNLARWRGEAGDAAGAAAALEELLADCLRVLGPDHALTLTTRHNLAYWRGEAGDAAGAAFEELLADRLRVVGPDHPDALITRHNLARYRGEAGDAAGAAADLEELLADYLRVLGPDHPDTLATRYSLARWRAEAGDAAGAAAAYQELLADRLRVLGPDHPATLATRNNLAQWRAEAGDAAGAAAAYQELLADRLRVLGPDHPDTLATLKSLFGNPSSGR